MASIETYFSGEKLQCSVGIVYGFISIAIAFYFLFLLKIPFYKGVGYPLLVISILLLIICISVVVRTPTDMQRVGSYVRLEPEKMKTEEVPRMQKVMHNFKVIKMIEIIVTVMGIVVLLFSPSGTILKGVGLGLVIQGMALYTFDHFAESRGKVYWEYLQNL